MDSRVRAGGLHEPAAGRDPQLGQIFINMRRAMNVSRETIARRLATRASTIDDFEAGAVASLPHWKETHRIVRGYCELLRLDPEPILWRIRSHLDALSNHARPPMPAPRAPMPTAPAVRPNGMPVTVMRNEDETERPKAARRRRRMRTLFTLSAPVALLAGLVYAAQAAPQFVYPVIAMLPDRLELPVRAGLEYMVLMTAPSRDGLRWIEVSDPQVRKADKLPTQ